MNNAINSFLMALLLTLSACKEGKSDKVMTFVTSAENPPFEYYQNGEIKGFDIDLAHLIAKEMGKEAKFENMEFRTILPSLDSGSADAAIATLTITEERQASFDFSAPYYVETMATVFPTNRPLTDQSQLSGKKIVCQMGSTMEIWLKKNHPTAERIGLDNNNQSIETLKAGHVDAVLLDGIGGVAFAKGNPGLSYAFIGKSEAGYGIAFKKGSPLKDQVNQALKKLEEKGEIKKLEQKWLLGGQ